MSDTPKKKRRPFWRKRVRRSTAAGEHKPVPLAEGPPARGRTAAELLNTLSAEELAAALRDLGDEPQADAIAAAVVDRRKSKPVERTKELRELVEAAAPVRIDKTPGAPPERKQKLAPITR